MSTRGTLILADVQRTIYTWIKREMDGVIPAEQIIWRNQSERVPPRPCVTMKIIDGPRRLSFSDNSQFLGGPPGSQFRVGGQRVMTVSIQVFGNSQVHKPMAMQLAIDLNLSLSRETVLEVLRRGGIGVQKQGDIQNITALEETEYEERAQFDVVFGVAQNVTDDPGIIETVNFTADVTGP